MQLKKIEINIYLLTKISLLKQKFYILADQIVFNNKNNILCWWVEIKSKVSQLLWVIKTQIEKYYGLTSVKSENHQNQHAYLQCIYRNIQQSKVLKNVEGVIKYLNTVPGMYHSMDSIASLYDIEIDKCLEN